MRRRHLLGAAALGAMSRLPAATAQPAWRPSRTVTLVVPFPPGGATDICARAMQPALQGLLGQTVVIENRPGATGVVGTRAVAAMPGDGHVLLVNASGTMTIQPALMRNPGFDPERDFKPILLAMSAPNVIIVHPSLPVRDMAGLRAWIATQGDTVSYSTAGIGSSDHLGMEVLLQRIGARAVHVPFPGGAPAITAVIQNTVALSMTNSGTAAPQIASGQVRAIAVAGPRRMSWAPDVPTLDEQGLADLHFSAWTGIWAPASTPEPVAQALHAACAAALRQPEVTERLSRINFQVEGGSSADLARRVSTDLARWRGVIRDAAIPQT